VVVAVAAMCMVEMVAHEVIDVIAVRHGLVSTSRPVHVIGIVTAARMPRLASRGVARVDRDHALVDVVAVGVVKVAIVEVVDVTVVLDGAMTAGRAVDVLVPLVNQVRAHREILSWKVDRNSGRLPVSAAPATARPRTLPTG
jgi:hypothetical protein